MSLQDPTGGPDKSRYGLPKDDDGELNTVGMGRITVLNYPIDNNIFAALCYLPLFPANLIPSIITLNTPTENREFMRFHAVQSLILNGVFFLFTLIMNGVMGIISLIPFIGGMICFVLGGLMFLVSIAYVVISLKLVIGAYRGETTSLPILSDYARQYSK